MSLHVYQQERSRHLHTINKHQEAMIKPAAVLKKLLYFLGKTLQIANTGIRYMILRGKEATLRAVSWHISIVSTST